MMPGAVTLSCRKVKFSVRAATDTGNATQNDQKGLSHVHRSIPSVHHLHHPCCLTAELATRRWVNLHHLEVLGKEVLQGLRDELKEVVSCKGIRVTLSVSVHKRLIHSNAICI